MTEHNNTLQDRIYDDYCKSHRVGKIIKEPVGNKETRTINTVLRWCPDRSSTTSSPMVHKVSVRDSSNLDRHGKVNGYPPANGLITFVLEFRTRSDSYP